jgi:hypothetical protein
MYFVYHKDWVPESVANRHQNNAVYGDFHLFVSGIEIETGIAPTNVLDVAGMGLEGDELIALFTHISSPDYVQTGAEGQVSKAQGRYIRDTLFPPVNEE